MSKQETRSNHLRENFTAIAERFASHSSSLDDVALETLQDESIRLRQQIAELQNQADEILAAPKAALTAFLYEGDRNNLGAEVQKLGECGRWALASILKDAENEPLRKRAFEAVLWSGTNPTDTPKLFISLLEHSNVSTRCYAIAALTDFFENDPSIIGPIAGKLSDAAAEVQDLAIGSLSSLREKAAPAVPALKALLEKSCFSVRAAYALAQIGAEPDLVLPILRDAFKNSPDISDVLLAVEAFSAIGAAAEEALSDLRNGRAGKFENGDPASERRLLELTEAAIKAIESKIEAGEPG